MRRVDREIIGLDNILAILDKCEIIRIGLCDGGKPYIVPLNFGYEVINEKVFIYMHCAAGGRKIDIINKNNNVCFEADCGYKLITAETACRYSAEYQSVIGEGVIEILKGEAQKIHGLGILMKRYGFNGKPSYDERALSNVTVLRISVYSVTGKAKLGK